MPPVGWMGLSSARRISPSRSGGSISARFSATVAPVTVSASPCSRPASSSAFITTGTPPTRSTVDITCAPNGLTSARCGTRSPIRLKSSSSSATPASQAIASRCSTAFVDPPNAITTAIAFSNASRVMICRAVIPLAIIPMTASPDARAMPSRRRSTAGGLAEPGSAMPSASAALAMVLAVYMPPQAPSPGQIARSIASTSVPGDQPAGAGADGLERVGDRHLPVPHVAGHDRPGVEEDGGQVEPRGGHQHPGQALVAAGQQHRAVEALGLHHGLHRVGDDLPADQRVVHPDVAHGDPVGDRDGAELHREAAGPVHALLRGDAEPLQRQVARGDLVPAGRDADLRLAEVLVAHADGAQHAAGRGPLQPVGDLAAARLEVDPGWSPPGVVGPPAACAAVARHRRAARGTALRTILACGVPVVRRRTWVSRGGRRRRRWRSPGRGGCWPGGP